MNSALKLAASLLEWNREQRKRYMKYYRSYGAELADIQELGDYTLALWRYPKENIVEVVISLGDLDWTDPQVQQARHPGSTMPMHAIASKLRDWLDTYGHLAVGSHSGRKVGLYKRLLQRLFPYAELANLKGTVPGGGDYFFVIDKDKGVLDRVQMGEPVRENINPRDFISDNPIPYRIEPVVRDPNNPDHTPAQDIWDVYSIGGTAEEKVGTIYYDLNVPENAAQYWRDNPYTALPMYAQEEPKSFAALEQAIQWLIHFPKR